MKPASTTGSDKQGTASAHTREANEKVKNLAHLRWEDNSDFEDAEGGFMTRDMPLIIKRQDGSVILDMEKYAELLQEASAPDTVNPSLWRHAKLNANAGLFKLCDRLYEIRGYDLSNMIVIQGDSGYVILDTLTSVETAAAAIALVYQTLGHQPIRAVIIGHSHLDHYGGIGGLVEPARVKEGTTRVYAPQGFTEAALSENTIAGPGTRRRSIYQFGFTLPVGADGLIDSGLGKLVTGGTPSFQYPTDSITRTGQEAVIDGVRFVFQLAPDSEAPASMQAYLPDFKALWVGELVNQTSHNLCPIRGAKPRDARAWSSYIHEMLRMFPDAELAFGSHFWPVHGKERVKNWLVKQRDIYKYMHDQTLRLASHGLTPEEIAHTLQLPQSLASEWFNRDYYGTLSANVKSIYTYYFGWYDGNPANLNPLPPAETARRLVECMGGATAALEKAREAYTSGEYQWAVQLLNYIVFAKPDYEEAVLLEASAYEQLGFQEESVTFRNAYLSAAQELRTRKLSNPRGKNTSIHRGLSIPDLVHILSVRLNGPRAEGVSLRLDWTIRDSGQTYALIVENAVLHGEELTEALRDELPGEADLSLCTTHEEFIGILFQGALPDELLQTGANIPSGNADKLTVFLSLLDSFDEPFPLVFPR